MTGSLLDLVTSPAAARPSPMACSVCVAYDVLSEGERLTLVAAIHEIGTSLSILAIHTAVAEWDLDLPVSKHALREHRLGRYHVSYAEHREDLASAREFVAMTKAARSMLAEVV